MITWSRWHLPLTARPLCPGAMPLTLVLIRFQAVTIAVAQGDRVEREYHCPMREVDEAPGV